MSHLHPVTNIDPPFEIDVITRGITNKSEKIKLMQGDHNSERIAFKMARHVDGHDMTQCNKVEVHYLNISSDTGERSADVYPVDDVAVDSESDDSVIFTWLVSGNATKYNGSLSFIISFKCLSGANIVYAWHTDVCSNAFTIGAGMDNGEAVVINNSDIIEAWKTEIINDLTPYIGENGNWFVDGQDLGVAARGPKGDSIVDSVDLNDEEKAIARRNIGASENCEMSPRVIVRPISVYDENAPIGDPINFEDIFVPYDSRAASELNYYSSYLVYGLEAHKSEGTTQRVYKSLDGGETWSEIGTFTIDESNGVWYTQIFADHIANTLILLKTTDGHARLNNEVWTFLWNGTGWYHSGTLKIGDKRWLSNCTSIDMSVNKDFTERIIMFGEYGTSVDGSAYTIWKSTDGGTNWTDVFSIQGNKDGQPFTGPIRHWHTVQCDPHTRHWWASSGDGDSTVDNPDGQCRIYRSTDYGENWELMFSGSQRERLCGFVFESDCIYYGMDSTNKNDPESIKIVKIDKQKLDSDRANCREDVATVDSAFAVWGLTRTTFPDGILVWSICESSVASLMPGRYLLQFYSFDTRRMHTVAYFNTTDSIDEYIGFYAGSRMQCAASGVIFAKPTPTLNQIKYGYSYTSTHVKINLTM